MTNPNDDFSLLNMLNALRRLRLSEPVPKATPVIPPPGYERPDDPFSGGFFSAAMSNPQELEMRLQRIFVLMTQYEEETPFKAMISTLDRRELYKMTYLMTSDPGYFMGIATNENGSKRLRMLLGRSADVDGFFSAAISRLFLQVMTDKYASYVATHGLRVFDDNNKASLYQHTLDHALQLARDQYGCIALKDIITDVDDPYYRGRLLDIVTHNALSLSDDIYGNFVINHVLDLNDLRCKSNIVVALRGVCVDLSFRKHASFVVERLLRDAEERVVVVVVKELLLSDGDRLLRVARDRYGNYVVATALKVTQMMSSARLFWGLVRRLTPFLHLLRGSQSHGAKIACFLDSLPH